MEVIEAILPLAVAILFLVVLQRPGFEASFLALILTVVLSLDIFSFALPLDQLLLALGVGIAKALPVFYVVLPSLLLYRILSHTGAMAVLGDGIARLVPDQDFRVLLLVIGLAPFTESASGFGVGSILVIPIFMVLGYSVVQACQLGLLGQMAVPWGGLAIGTTLGAELTAIDPNQLGAYTAILSAPLPVIYGLLALFITGGKQALRRRWYVALVAGSQLTLSVFGFSLVPGIELAGILAGAGVMAILTTWARRQNPPQLSLRCHHENKNHRGVSFAQAIGPYSVLTILLLVTRLVPASKTWLKHHGVLLIPSLDLNLPLLYHPGFYLLLTVLVSLFIFSIRYTEFRYLAKTVLQKFVPGAAAIISFVMVSQLMQANGMTTMLGAAAATLGVHYKWIAPWLAALGGWMTGSNVGSNALFSHLQQEVSLQSGLPLNWLMGVQNAASAHATMISPTRTIFVATAVGWTNGETFLLKQLSPVVISSVILMTFLLAILIGSNFC